MKIIPPFSKSQLTSCFNLALIFLLFCPSLLFSQNSTTLKKERREHNEKPMDAYLPLSRNEAKKSPATRYKDDIIFNVQVNVTSEGENIVGDAANEPSLAIDPVDPNRMFIGWRQFDNINSNFRQAGFGYTLDGGETWIFPGVIEPGIFRSDPVLDSDSDGNVFYNSLSVPGNDYICDVFKIDHDSVSWDEGTYAHGGDKQWMVIDKSGGVGDGNNYSFWNVSFSVCAPGAFTRSADDGQTFEECVAVDGTPRWGTCSVGPDGELYLVGRNSYNGLCVVKSSNAQNDEEAVDWDFYTQFDIGGSLEGWAPINPSGILGQAYVDVDRSEGPGKGNVYVLASVVRDEINDPADVMFARSTDGGVTFEDPTRINDDIGSWNYQWFGTMSVAPNGRIDVVWLDTRDATDDQYYSALYYSYSIDQGETWSENTKLSDSFDPHVGWPNQQKMGDYFDMESDNVSAHLAWANTLNGEQDVNYARITPDIEYTGMLDPNKLSKLTTLKASPNPLAGHTKIQYYLPVKCHASITLFDIYGKEIKQLQNGVLNSGSYSLDLHIDDLAEGIYFCTLRAGSVSKTSRLILMK